MRGHQLGFRRYLAVKKGILGADGKPIRTSMSSLNKNHKLIINQPVDVSVFQAVLEKEKEKLNNRNVLNVSVKRNDPFAPQQSILKRDDPNLEKEERKGRKKSEDTNLLKEIKSRIEITGPLTVASFMQSALMDKNHGYYATKEHIFGEKGDFITSPEISQLFGEMIAIWTVSNWMQQGQPQSFDLVEIGPGRGFLMSDFLRSIKRFPNFLKSLRNIYLVESSPRLRKEQEKNLKTLMESFKISWVSEFSDVKKDQKEASITTYIVAQELYDALPVHQFRFTEFGWREKLVDVLRDEDDSEPDQEGLHHHLRFVLAKSETISSKLLFNHKIVKDSKHLPKNPKVGDKIEIPVVAEAISYEIGTHLLKNGGAALIFDYGIEKGFCTDSLRGIQKHRFVHPLKEPGRVDLSVDVPFEIVMDAFRNLRGGEGSSSTLYVENLVSQAQFLHEMGIGIRAQRLFEANQKVYPGLADAILEGYKRLIDESSDTSMGKLFKAIRISHNKASSSSH